MIVSKKAVDFIVFCEVSSKEYYNKRLTGLMWPGGESGATIGIGYDLGYQTVGDITKDWIKEIGISQVNILRMFAGLRGEKAHTAITRNSMARKVDIPFAAAYNVFIKSSLPLYAKRAEAVYPGLSELTPDAAGAIVSLVYNRGNSLVGDRRQEMKAIAPLVKAKDYKGIADQLLAMRRLWNNGLVKRREGEAALVAGALRQYSQAELITV